jgi:hypothetical protein
MGDQDGDGAGQGDDGSGGDGNSGPPDEAGKTFTAAELEAVVKQRLQRQAGKYADYTALKDKASKYEEHQKATQSEHEKAIAEARAEERVKAQSGFAEKLAAAEVKAALTGLVDDPDDIIEDLNLSRFVGADGEVDSEAVKALKTKYEGLAGRKEAAGRGAAGRVAGHGTAGKGGAVSAADAFAEAIEGLLR